MTLERVHFPCGFWLIKHMRTFLKPDINTKRKWNAKIPLEVLEFLKKRRNIQIERQERKLDEKSSFAKGSARSVRLTNSGLSFAWVCPFYGTEPNA